MWREIHLSPSRQADERLACETRVQGCSYEYIIIHVTRELAQIGKLRLPVRVALQNAHTRVGRLTSNVRLITHVSQCQTIIYHGIRSCCSVPFRILYPAEELPHFKF